MMPRGFFAIEGATPRETGVMYRNVLRIAWPAALEGALMSVISAIDTIMVGTLGPAAIAAVGLTAQPRMLIQVAAQALCVGTMAITARRRGAGDDLGARSCMHQSMQLITILGILISIAGAVFSTPIMRLAGANDETIAASSGYFRVISVGFLANCWQLCICAGFRALGKTGITLVTHLTANLLNVVLNYLLIGGKFGFPALGVRGAAIATCVGTVTAGMISLWFAGKKNSYFRYRLWRVVPFEKETVKALGRIGLASASESVFLRAGFLITQKIVAGIGTNAFAAYQIVSQVSSLSFTLGDGVAAAGVALVGQSLGAKEKNRARQYVKCTRMVGFAVSVILMLIIAFSSRALPRLFTRDLDVIRVSQLSFMVMTVGLLPQNGRVIYAGCLRGAGDVKYVAMCSLLGVAILRPLLTYLFCYPVHQLLPALRLVEAGPWAAYVIDAFFRNALLSRRVRQGKWVNIRL